MRQVRVLFLLCLCAGASAAQRSIDFNRDVRPILSDNCIACHGPDKEKRKAGLRLDVKDPSQEDGAIKAGDPEQSDVIARVTSTDEDEAMPPPKTGKKLTPAQVETLRAWIKSGASYAKHWAFVKPERPNSPAVQARDWVRNEIDRFILARLEKEGIKPSPEADPTTLLRRASLDAIGLPPSREEVAQFLARGDWTTLIESLLSSPHHGERWGRHWLDMARYADSNGYSIDAPRSIWKYRDWVIDAFNKDMPFDQFTIEQIAGDLLPNATVEQKTATGFHRNTQINEEGGIDKEQFRIESVVDRVNTTGSAFLGLTLGCAQCHDHKFDPISQKEYFQLFAFLNNQDEPNLNLGAPDEVEKLEQSRALIKQLEDQIREQEKDAARFEKELKEAKQSLATARRSTPKITTTMVMEERAEPRESYVHIKGDFTRRGEIVGPGILSALQPLKAAGGKTNRLDLARWLVDRENPLTARVLVNRIWHKYFGRGLVETENDFGSQGTPPTHPELLDWLAVELMDNGWSQKHIHRLILNSATYRQSSHARPDLKEVDANNYLLARQSRLRLDAEIVRDVGLRVSGLLVPEIGGPSVFPPQPDGVMNLGQSRREWKESQGGDRYRRGMYTYFWRATPHPSLTVFDAPDAFSACTRRPRSNTPLQSLTTLNDRAYYEFAEALARRVIAEDAPERARLQSAFEHCVSRKPTEGELKSLQKLAADCAGESEEMKWTTIARALLNLDETITRE